MTDGNSTKVEQTGPRQHVQSTEALSDDSPAVSVRWAVRWVGMTARCVFHEQLQTDCAACRAVERESSFLHRAVTSLTELLNGPCDGSRAIEMVVFVRDNELQLTMISENGPLLTLAIPSVPEVTAAQAWMERWLALKTGRTRPQVQAKES